MSAPTRSNTQIAAVDLSSAAQIFLQQHCPAGWHIKEKLAGDCGRRSYTRLALPVDAALPQTALLMHTPDTDELYRFCALSRYLETHNLRAPHVIATDAQHWALIEDFGDVTVKKALCASREAWPAVQNTLVTLVEKTYTTTPPRPRAQAEKLRCPAMDVAFLMNEVRIFMDWALPCMECADADHAEVLGWWQAMLTPLETQPFGSILTLRDVHSENLMIVAHKDSAMCGLLDFQDAMWGPPSYDVVSMLQDVRLPFDARASETRRHAIAQHLTARTKVPPEAFEWPYDLLGLQRAVKIFGVFSRLALQDKNTSMMRYLPNTARWILHGLQAQNAPAPLTVWFNKLDLLGTLKARHDLT